MKYNVLHIAYPLAPVNNNTAGGAEQVVYLIDKALTETNNNSYIIACSGSSPHGRLIESETISEPFDDYKVEQLHRRLNKFIEEVLSINHFDIIHMHGIDFHSYIPDTDTPILVTLHLPVDWYNQDSLSSYKSNIFFNCVSRTQEGTAGNVKNLLPYIQNGIDLNLYSPGKNKEGFILSLGRICWEKGYNLSIMAAQMSGSDLILAGKVFPYYHHQKYFRESILPSINDRDIRFIDSPGINMKKELLAAAKCILIPSLVSETSSLVAMEALASGTPVIAFPSGALSEIVEHGKTGYIVNNVEEMAEAIKQVNSIDTKVCRSTAEARFDYRRMAGEYIDAYKIILANEVKQQD